MRYMRGGAGACLWPLHLNGTCWKWRRKWTHKVDQTVLVSPKFNFTILKRRMLRRSLTNIYIDFKTDLFLVKIQISQCVVFSTPPPIKYDKLIVLTDFHLKFSGLNFFLLLLLNTVLTSCTTDSTRNSRVI